MTEDVRRLSDYFSFDKILSDVPCSGSKTENIYSKNFTEELIKSLVKVQEELLKKLWNIKIRQRNGVLYVFNT